MSERRKRAASAALRAAVLGWAARWRACAHGRRRCSRPPSGQCGMIHGPVRGKGKAVRCGKEKRKEGRCWAASGPVREGKKNWGLGRFLVLGQNGRR